MTFLVIEGKQSIDHAEVFFRRAIDLEPNVPRPYAGLSFVNYERAYLNLDNNRHNSLRKALEFAREAISIDATDPMGHWAMSRATFLHGDLDAAHSSITEATDLNPSYANAQYFLGWVSMQLGDHETECGSAEGAADASNLEEEGLEEVPRLAGREAGDAGGRQDSKKDEQPQDARDQHPDRQARRDHHEDHEDNEDGENEEARRRVVLGRQGFLQGPIPEEPVEEPNRDRPRGQLPPSSIRRIAHSACSRTKGSGS